MESKYNKVHLGIILVLGFWLGIGFVAFMDEVTATKCVPGNAVDYRGDLKAWTDRQGYVVMLSPEEDTYNFCTRR